MRYDRRCVKSTVAGLAAMMAAFGLAHPTPALPAEPETVRVAVIGGMVETGFWKSIGERFEKATGHKVEVVISGPKRVIAIAFEDGKADLITMHASDTIINLVADGYALDPRPWLKNDLVIVGPKADPAGIRGMTDAAEAMKKVLSSGSPFVVHSSLGAQEVLRDVLEPTGFSLRPDRTSFVFSDRSRDVLKKAEEEKAYTLVGRIPFLNGKMPNPGLVLMVQGDPRLRRPYLVAVANPSRFPQARVKAATQLAEFLRREETQQWIAGYGRGQIDDQPLFFRVSAQPVR
jgi:tungstate transport system substrate-binding protein